MGFGVSVLKQAFEKRVCHDEIHRGRVEGSAKIEWLRSVNE
jgi:hypothetical protein